MDRKLVAVGSNLEESQYWPTWDPPSAVYIPRRIFKARARLERLQKRCQRAFSRHGERTWFGQQQCQQVYMAQGRKTQE